MTAPRSAIVIGLMSGTSLDGISAAAARFTLRNEAIDAELLGYVSRAYTPGERSRLAAALQAASPAEYCRLNVDLGHWLADAAVAVAAHAGVDLRDVAACSAAASRERSPGV